MNSTRTLFRLHSWMGVITGVLMIVIALTGVVLVYGAEVDRLLNQDIKLRPVPTHPASVDAMLRAVRARFSDHHVGLISFPIDEQAPYVTSLRKITSEGEFVRYQVYLDPGSGEIVGQRVSGNYFTSWLLRLHAALILPDRWGEPLVAVLGIIMALSGVTGLWVYRKKIWDALKFSRTTARLGTMHANLGVWTCLFAVLLGITGTILNWSSVLLVCRAPPVPQLGSEWQILDRMPPADALLVESHRAFPELEVHGVYFPSKPGEPVKVGGYVPGAHILGKSSYVAFAISPVPRVTAIYDARKASLGMRLLLMTNSLHYGDFAGQGSKVAYAIGGLVLTFLAGSGLWIWFRRAAPRKRDQPQDSPSIGAAKTRGVT